MFTAIFRPAYQLNQSAVWTNISLCKEYVSVLSRSDIHTLLWPRVWYACSGYRPNYHVYQKLLAKIPFQEPTPLLLLGRDMAQIHSNLQCNEFLSHRPFLHIFEYPIWLQFLAPDLQRHSYLKFPPWYISAQFFGKKSRCWNTCTLLAKLVVGADVHVWTIIARINDTRFQSLTFRFCCLLLSCACCKLFWPSKTAPNIFSADQALSRMLAILPEFFAGVLEYFQCYIAFPNSS